VTTKFEIDRIQCFDCGSVYEMKHMEWDHGRKVWMCKDRMACQAEPTPRRQPKAPPAAASTLEEALAQAEAPRADEEPKK
jgi:hypothetical protein